MEDNKLNKSLERVIASLTEEQKEKVKACKDMNELVALLGELGVELPDELLDDVGGGLDLGFFFNRPMILPALGRLFGFTWGDDGIDATHMDLKGGYSMDATHMDLTGTPAAGAVHTDVSAATKEQGKTRYV